MATHLLKHRAKREFGDVRNYECTICDVSYSNPDLLSAHIDAHVNERSHSESSSNEQKKIIIEYECSPTMVPSRILSVSKEREVIVIDGHEYRRYDKDAEEASQEGHDENNADLFHSLHNLHISFLLRYPISLLRKHE